MKQLDYNQTVEKNHEVLLISLITLVIAFVLVINFY